MKRCSALRSVSQSIVITIDPISAAGGPPSRTIATTIGRKLPESLTFEVVVTAVRSVKIAKASRIPSSDMSQSAVPAVKTPAITTARRPTTCKPVIVLVGRLSSICCPVEPGGDLPGGDSAEEGRSLREPHLCEVGRKYPAQRALTREIAV